MSNISNVVRALQRKVSILENGYVIDDVYYEEIDYYKEEKEVK